VVRIWERWALLAHVVVCGALPDTGTPSAYLVISGYRSMMAESSRSSWIT